MTERGKIENVIQERRVHAMGIEPRVLKSCAAFSTQEIQAFPYQLKKWPQRKNIVPITSAKIYFRNMVPGIPFLWNGELS